MVSSAKKNSPKDSTEISAMFTHLKSYYISLYSFAFAFSSFIFLLLERFRKVTYEYFWGRESTDPERFFWPFPGRSPSKFQSGMLFMTDQKNKVSAKEILK